MKQPERDKKFKEVIEGIESGLSAKVACKEVGVSTSWFRKWKGEGENVALYTRAREARADVLAEEIIEIADSEPKTIESEYGDKVDTGDIQQKRLRVDARKWAAAKMNPKKYGDKIDHTTDGEKFEGFNVHIIRNREDLEDSENQ